MKLDKAIKTGKMFKRPAHARWSSNANNTLVDLCFLAEDGRKYSYDLTVEDLAAEDWEVEEQPITLTKTQFLNAVAKARKLIGPTPLDYTYTEVMDNLIKELFK